MSIQNMEQNSFESGNASSVVNHPGNDSKAITRYIVVILIMCLVIAALIGAILLASGTIAMSKGQNDESAFNVITNTNVPTNEPTISPSSVALIIDITQTNSPTINPSIKPSIKPSLIPSTFPSEVPSKIPSLSPTIHPSISPSIPPSISPTINPTLAPSKTLTGSPSIKPSISPIKEPSKSPIMKPSSAPSEQPSISFVTAPTNPPIIQGDNSISTPAPTSSPATTLSPTNMPTKYPSIKPTKSPMPSPSETPTIKPTKSPFPSPSLAPTSLPSNAPSIKPSKLPTQSPSLKPTESPVLYPTNYPSNKPSSGPTETIYEDCCEKITHIDTKSIDCNDPNIVSDVQNLQLYLQNNAATCAKMGECDQPFDDTKECTTKLAQYQQYFFACHFNAPQTSNTLVAQALDSYYWHETYTPSICISCMWPDCYNTEFYGKPIITDSPTTKPTQKPSNIPTKTPSTSPVITVFTPNSCCEQITYFDSSTIDCDSDEQLTEASQLQAFLENNRETCIGFCDSVFMNGEIAPNECTYKLAKYQQYFFACHFNDPRTWHTKIGQITDNYYWHVDYPDTLCYLCFHRTWPDCDPATSAANAMSNKETMKIPFIQKMLLQVRDNKIIRDSLISSLFVIIICITILIIILFILIYKRKKYELISLNDDQTNENFDDNEVPLKND